MASFNVRPRQVKRVLVRCAWVKYIHGHQPGVIDINGARYTVVPLADDNGGIVTAVGNRAAYRLVKEGSDDGYDVNVAATPPTCTCPSYVWDHCPVQAGGDGVCKHVAALRALGLVGAHFGPTAA